MTATKVILPQAITASVFKSLTRKFAECEEGGYWRVVNRPRRARGSCWGGRVAVSESEK